MFVRVPKKSLYIFCIILELSDLLEIQRETSQLYCGINQLAGLDTAQPTFTCSKSRIEILEKGVKYARIQQ